MFFNCCYELFFYFLHVLFLLIMFSEFLLCFLFSQSLFFCPLTSVHLWVKVLLQFQTSSALMPRGVAWLLDSGLIFSSALRVINDCSLSLLSQVDWSKFIAVNGATAHPHYDPDGTAYNMGNSYGSKGLSLPCFTRKSQLHFITFLAFFFCPWASVRWRLRCIFDFQEHSITSSEFRRRRRRPQTPCRGPKCSVPLCLKTNPTPPTTTALVSLAFVCLFSMPSDYKSPLTSLSWFQACLRTTWCSLSSRSRWTCLK